MLVTTRTPRVLAKLSDAPARAALRFGATSVPASFERLFQQWHLITPDASGAEVNVWDLCHHLVVQGFGVAGISAAQFAEPDLEQQWITGTPAEHAMAAAQTGDKATGPDSRLPPAGSDYLWFRDASHSQLEAARTAVGEPADRIRIAHFDTGYDPNHQTIPKFLRKDLARNFVDGGDPNDAIDHTAGMLTNLGHGTGTLSILAGASVNGVPLGGAPSVEVIPVRVANSVVLFQNSAIAKAFDYAHQLCQDPAKRPSVITMSMGGLASQAWADAVNALYELGVFIVTAAGNNFGNLPTRNIVYPARFKRVVAACGVMADGKPYADLPIGIMAGNYGPDSKMSTALAGFTPNTPWARLGTGTIVDRDGRGTSAATPQVAAAAALWIQTFKKQWEGYPEGWMRVEAVRKALFDTAHLNNAADRSHLGCGAVQANAALSQQPAAAASLQKQPEDVASFPFLRVITGLGMAPAADVRQRMLELEALQIAQGTHALEQLLPDPESPGELSAADRQRIIELLHDAPGASSALRAELGKHAAPVVAPQQVQPKVPTADEARLQLAMNPPIRKPETRDLRVFAFDPLLSYNPDFLHINQTTLKVKWEPLEPGPVGEYLEVMDVDPSTGCCYAPVDLNHPSILSQAGLSPSEADPRFHQQMVYAVAMKTIEHFERALGRVALWAPRFHKYEQDGKPQIEKHYVRRLRIYPHALREANSFYSPDKKALLLGYFPASKTDPDENLPGGIVFCSLSHDIIAHETTHALLDGLHRYFGEPSNPDVLAFHEAFADIVALFQHFTVPEALRDVIAHSQGNLEKQNMLAELAQQFGQGIGQYGALRSAINKEKPTRDDYNKTTEPHERGAVLVAAVFDAFLNIYRRRSEDLIRLATAGTGILPEGGAIPNDLVNRLAQEASKTAGHVLNICIRALDYCPPVDLRFGEYLRGLITADRDLVPDDKWGYRAAFIQGFRRRGIYPENVRNLSSESLCWERPETSFSIEGMIEKLKLTWDLHVDRRKAFQLSMLNGSSVHKWLKEDPGITDEDALSLGFYRGEGKKLTVNGRSGGLRPFEVHSVRPVRRIGPDGQQRIDLVVEIAQSWLPDEGDGKFRGGCTLVVDLGSRTIRCIVRKRVGHEDRMREEEAFRMKMAAADLSSNYFGDAVQKREPFAMMHRGM